MKKWALPIFIGISFLFFIVQSPWFRKNRLIVGAHPWIGYESLFLAQDFSWLPEKVEIRQTTSARETLQLLQNGTIDAGALTLDETVHLLEFGIPIQIILVLDISAGADAIVAKESFDLNRENLLGKKIAVEKRALGEFFLRKFLKHYGVKIEELEILDLSPADQLSYIKKFDIAVTYEPYVSLFENEGWVRIFDSRNLPDTIFDVLVIQKDINFWQKLLVADLVKAHFQALNHIRLNQIDATHRIAARRGTSLAIVRNSLMGVYLPNEAGNHFYLSEKKFLVDSLMEIAQIMEMPVDKLKKFTRDVINDRFLPSLD